MKFIDLINESNYEDKPRLQKRAIDFYKHARIRKFKLKQHNTNTFPINNDETIEHTIKVELPHEIKMDWNHRGDPLIQLNGIVKIYYPSEMGEKAVRDLQNQLLDKCKKYFEKYRIIIGTMNNFLYQRIPVENTLNEMTEDVQLKKATDVYKFLRRGTIEYKYEIRQERGRIYNPNELTNTVMVKYELPPVENVHVGFNEIRTKPLITFKDEVKYDVLKGERFDKDDIIPEELIEIIILRFLKYNIILVDENEGHYQTFRLDYDGPDDDEPLDLY